MRNKRLDFGLQKVYKNTNTPPNYSFENVQLQKKEENIFNYYTHTIHNCSLKVAMEQLLIL